MKPRIQIINEIILENEKHPQSIQNGTLRSALLNMQDAMLFQLANELGISLEVRS